MRIIEERRLRRQTRAIAAFWAWWRDDGDAATTAAIASGDWNDIPERIGALVHAIDPGLSWETGPAAEGSHRLTVTAGGNMRLRALAERWLRNAPRTDPGALAQWIFSATKPRVPLSAATHFGINGAQLDLASTRFTIRDTKKRALDVTVHHEGFESMHQAERMEAAVLILDLVLGEDDVERWIGAIAASRRVEVSAAGAEKLIRHVMELGGDGEPGWLMLSARRSSGAGFFIQTRERLTPIDYLPFDLHTEVRIRYSRREDGMPASNEELGRVQDVQQEVDTAIAGRGVIVAHTMERGVRIVHCYSDAMDANVRHAIDLVARARRGVRVRHRVDPAWQGVREIRDILRDPDLPEAKVDESLR